MGRLSVHAAHTSRGACCERRLTSLRLLRRVALRLLRRVHALLRVALLRVHALRLRRIALLLRV
jgi:hypothetical protein